MSSQNVGKRQVKMSFFDKMKMLLIVNIVVKNFSAFANLYNKTGEYEKAGECYLKMAEIYSSRGFDVEAERMKLFAKEALERQQNK